MPAQSVQASNPAFLRLQNPINQLAFLFWGFFGDFAIDVEEIGKCQKVHFICIIILSPGFISLVVQWQ